MSWAWRLLPFVIRAFLDLKRCNSNFVEKVTEQWSRSNQIDPARRSTSCDSNACTSSVMSRLSAPLQSVCIPGCLDTPYAAFVQVQHHVDFVRSSGRTVTSTAEKYVFPQLHLRRVAFFGSDGWNGLPTRHNPKKLDTTWVAWGLTVIGSSFVTRGESIFRLACIHLHKPLKQHDKGLLLRNFVLDTHPWNENKFSSFPCNWPCWLSRFCCYWVHPRRWMQKDTDKAGVVFGTAAFTGDNCEEV